MLLLLGCEKHIDFKLDQSAPKLVVDASIENNRPPVVTLTRSLNYFSSFNLQDLSKVFVHDATVLVSDGVRTHKLKEYEVPIGFNLSVYYYSVDSSNLSTAFLGAVKHAYSLEITDEGKQYKATTTIPDTTRRIDSIWWKKVSFGKDTTKVAVFIRAYDPPGFGDYIRYYTKSNRQSTFYPPTNSVYDDLFIDGTTYEVQVQPGYDRNADSTERDFFFRGDTVAFKVSNIDRAAFDFWRTWEFAISSIGNPFSTPSKILGNISNGALGNFTGYGAQYRTLIIPK